MSLHWKKSLGVLGSAMIMFALTFAGCGQDASNTVDDGDGAGIVVSGQWEENSQQAGSESPEGPEVPDSSEKAGSPENPDSEGDLESQEKTCGNIELPALAVDGTRLVDSQGSPVQLKGISTHGLAWYPDYVNADCFAQLKEEWGIDVIRLAMYTGESGGYCTGGDREALKELVRSGVKYATDCGLYVIIDWHILSDGNPNTYIEESKAFFQEMSQEYADHSNVLYEICNEPNGGTSWSEVKTYAEQIISVIRENDGDGVILVGTPNWCQFVDQAAADPIQDCENVMYTLHFYAATHQDDLRNTMVSAIEAGLPIFVSEFGICDASGNGAIDQNQADKWVSVLDQYGVSYVAWNLSNKAETSALIKSSSKKLSGFTAEDLSASGKWLYSLLTGKSSEQAGEGWTGCNTPPPASADSGTEKNLTDASGLEIAASVVNSWEQGDLSYYQYTLTITNPTETTCTGWTLEVNFTGDITLENGWNGNYEADGSKLVITAMDYNSEIPAGGSVSDIGFIVSGSKELNIR